MDRHLLEAVFVMLIVALALTVALVALIGELLDERKERLRFGERLRNERRRRWIHMDETSGGMTFEQWQTRPVYVVQCKTAAIAAEMGLPICKLRILPGMRDSTSEWVRNTVSNLVRKERSE